MLVALKDRVIAKRLPDPEAKTEGGLILPDAVMNSLIQFSRSIVINTYKDSDIRPNDLIIHPRGAGIEIVSNEGEKYLLLRESEILAVERENK